MPPRLAPYALALTLLTGTLWATACAPPEPPLGLRSHDLVVHGEWLHGERRTPDPASASPTSPGTTLQLTEAFCGDETFLALPVPAGQEVHTSWEPTGEPTASATGPTDETVLHLAGCSSPPKGPASSDDEARELEVEVTFGGTVFGNTVEDDLEGGREPREPRSLRIPLEPQGGAFRAKLDLGPQTQARASLRVRADRPGDPGGTVWLREARLASTVRVATVEGDGGADPESRPPQILLISVDTLREDALGTFGGAFDDDRPYDFGEASTTPNLRRFVEDAQVFRPHYASAGWTRPSHGTMLTGLAPVACGAMGAEGALRPALRTLAERFQDAGFRTHALVYDVEWFHPRFDFDRGFADYRVERWRLDRAVPEVASWISEHRNEPFFFFFHTFEPHSDAHHLPYESTGSVRETLAQRFDLPDYGCRAGHCASHLLVEIDEGRVKPLPGEREILHYLYSRSAGFVDRELGRLFDELRRLDLYRDLLIVLTSDHGEVLLDHGQLLHGKAWEEVIRVPLAIKWPGAEHAGEHRTMPTGSEDLAPTLLEAAGLDASDLPGASLLRRRRAAPIFVGHNFRAVIHEGLKAVFRDPEPPWLFDLENDPGETRNLAEERPEDLEALRRLGEAKWELDRKLAERYDQGDAPEVPGLTPEERRRLRALGYLRDSPGGASLP